LEVSYKFKVKEKLIMSAHIRKEPVTSQNWLDKYYLIYFGGFALSILLLIGYMVIDTMPASSQDILNINDCPGLQDHLNKLTHPISKGNLKGFCDNALHLQDQVRAVSTK
jgi:hypothetical protein